MPCGLYSMFIIYVQCFTCRFNITVEGSISVLQGVTEFHSSAYTMEQLIKFHDQNGKM